MSYGKCCDQQQPDHKQGDSDADQHLKQTFCFRRL
jgi:hypothetical protein